MVATIEVAVPVTCRYPWYSPGARREALTVAEIGCEPLGSSCTVLVESAGAGLSPTGVTAMEYVSLTVPTFDRVRFSVLSIEPEPVPKFNAVGYAATVPPRAAATFSTPAPACCTVAGTPGPEVGGPALSIKSERYCATVSPGRAALRTAAAPAARGAEKLVPAVSIKPDGSQDSPDRQSTRLNSSP